MDKTLRDWTDAALAAAISKADADRAALKDAIRAMVVERDQRAGRQKLAELAAALNLPSPKV